MPPGIFILPPVFAIPALVWIVRMTYRHKERMAELEGGRARDPETEARLRRLEQAVDAIAIAVERVGEGQRFVTRLLEERAGTADLERRSGQDVR
jgi:hypothetical protein